MSASWMRYWNSVAAASPSALEAVSDYKEGEDEGQVRITVGAGGQ